MNDSLLSKVNKSFNGDDGKVVKKISSIEFRMDGNPRNIFLHMRIEFCLMVHIPLSQTNSKVFGSVSFDAMAASISLKKELK
jgi:hypothetical protein